MQFLIRRLTTVPDTQDRPCWKEVLESAMVEIYPTDQQLEQMRDHLERTP